MAAPFDNHANLASSFVVTAPGLAGITLTVVAGEGALFPLPPFNCTVCPANTFPTQSNTEIVRVTAKAGDTFTILRAQEGTTAKDIQPGFFFGNSITAKVITDIETLNSPTWGNIGGDISDQSDLNDLIATFAQAGLTTGVVSETDTVLLSAPDNFTLRIAPLQQGIFSLLLGTGLPAADAIKTFPQTDFPLANLGLVADGTFTRWVGYTSAGTVVTSTMPYAPDPNVIGIGFIAVKRVAGVVTFIDDGGPRSFATVPEMAGFSELERTYLRYASTVVVKWAGANMNLSRLAGVINGTSVNWTGVGNKNSLAQAAASPAGFIQINPASAAATVFPPVVTVLTATNYWNGAASVPLSAAAHASVKRILLGIKGGLFVQEGEADYVNLNAAIAAVPIAPFTTIFAQDTFIEIGRVAVQRNATDLSNPGQAQFFVTGAAAGGSSGSAISAVTSILGTPTEIDASSPVGAVTLSLANTPVVPGSYTTANITVDAKGRVTAASNGSAAGGVASVTGTANEITATPTTGPVVVSLPAALNFTGKTVTNGTFNAANVTSFGVLKLNRVGQATSANLELAGDAGQFKQILFQTGANNRWSFAVTGGAESGANAGSDLTIARWNDAGGYIQDMLQIQRSTGDTLWPEHKNNFRYNGIGSASVPVVSLNNDTSAGPVLAQWSPALQFKGDTWRTGLGNRVSVWWRVEAQAGVTFDGQNRLVFSSDISDTPNFVPRVSFSDLGVDIAGGASTALRIEHSGSSGSIVATNTSPNGPTTSANLSLGNRSQPLALNDRMGAVIFSGVYGNSGLPLPINSALIGAYANESWAGTTFGSRITFDVTPNGSAGRLTIATVSGSGLDVVGQITSTGNLTINGGANMRMFVNTSGVAPNRFAFQEVTTNAAIALMALPNGTNPTATIGVCSDSAYTNGIRCRVATAGGQAYLVADAIGATAAPVLNVQAQGVQVATFASTGLTVTGALNVNATVQLMVNFKSTAADPYIRIDNAAGTIQAFMQAVDSSAAVGFGSITNHPVVIRVNNAQVATFAATRFTALTDIYSSLSFVSTSVTPYFVGNQAGATSIQYGSLGSLAPSRILVNGITIAEVNSTGLAVSGNIVASGNSQASGAGGFLATTFAPNQRNPMYRFGNADAFGMSFFQGTSSSDGINSIGIHFGTANPGGCVFEATNSSQVNVRGNLVVTGSVSKGSGTFTIPHPLPEKHETHNLVHSFIEGPRADLIYRGVVTLDAEGTATVNLDDATGMTQGTFALLAENAQVWVQNDSGWNQVRGSVAGNVLTIEAEEPVADTVSWLVIAERHDEVIRGADWTDDNGKPIIEPLKKVAVAHYK